MLRIRFEAGDQARVRFAVSPLAQAEESACALLRPSGRPFYADWRKRVKGRLPAAAEPLLRLVGADDRYVPDLLTPDGLPGGTRTVADELDALGAVPADRACGELAELAGRVARPGVAGPLTCADTAWHGLVAALRAHHAACLADDWPAIRAHLEADVAVRARMLAAYGLDHVLATLHPALRWEPPELVFPSRYPEVRFDLGGRGLVLMPTVFNGAVTTVLNAFQQPVLRYPIARLGDFWHGRTDPAADGLERLIGRGRTAALRALGGGCGTVELASRLGVAPATASEAVAALRNAGLVATVRQGRGVLHTPTGLGADLLSASLR